MKPTLHVYLAIAGIVAMVPAAAMAESFQTTKIKHCAIEYKAAKALAKDKPTDTNVEAVASWPKYWSACAKANKDNKFLTRKQAKAAQ